jgi:(p)ppGpp synthase/HD superfamily hydrolase
MNPLEAAISIAAAAHDGQFDKAGEPYILHPLRVMMRFPDDKRRIIAVLHDVVEDSRDWQLCDLRDLGEEICEAIDALTRREGENYEAYIQRVGANPLARDVKIADLRDNMSPDRIEAIAGDGNKLVTRYSKALSALHSQGEAK